MAGHSKFKNIQFRKGAQDKKRSKLFSKLGREITAAAKMGMPDPAMNPRLRTAVTAARRILPRVSLHPPAGGVVTPAVCRRGQYPLLRSSCVTTGSSGSAWWRAEPCALPLRNRGTVEHNLRSPARVLGNVRPGESAGERAFGGRRRGPGDLEFFWNSTGARGCHRRAACARGLTPRAHRAAARRRRTRGRAAVGPYAVTVIGRASRTGSAREVTGDSVTYPRAGWSRGCNVYVVVRVSPAGIEICPGTEPSWPRARCSSM